jgi:transposase
MAANFIGCDREQVFLMPPSLRDWVPEDHLVWTILEAVEEMDLSGFYADYRAHGHGRPAYDPRMMVALWWPGALQPPAPTDLGVTVSRHRALLITPSTCGPCPSG